MAHGLNQVGGYSTVFGWGLGGLRPLVMKIFGSYVDANIFPKEPALFLVSVIGI